MDAAPRKKSPRAPSLALDAAIERALKIYKEENRHPAPADVVAQHLGYKGANNGAFVSTMATLGYYGLVERTKEGRFAVTKSLESYHFAPEESMRRKILVDWLKTPAIFSALLERYGERLPSDGNIKFDLIHQGFAPTAADACVTVFRRSVEYVDYYAGRDVEPNASAEETREEPGVLGDFVEQPNLIADPGSDRLREPASAQRLVSTSSQGPADGDRIPVRLSGGRRAWIEVPSPFYQADKKRLISQIELLLADDETEEAPNE